MNTILKLTLLAIGTTQMLPAFADSSDSVILSSKLWHVGNCENVHQNTVKNILYGEAAQLEITYKTWQPH